jgi:hypothetical protein
VEAPLIASAALLRAADDAGAVVAFRAFPVAAFALCKREVSGTAKLLLASVCVAMGWAFDLAHRLPLVCLSATYVYFLVVGAGVPVAARWLRAGRMTAAATFVCCAGAFFVIPAATWPPIAKTLTLVVGWDVMLSAYSYCVEAMKRDEGDDPPLSDCLFFLLVNPALVYAQRGERIGAPRVDPRGIVRALLGVATTFAVSALLVPSFVLAHERLLGAEGDLATFLPCAVAYGMLRFGIEYGRQSALASLQIGMLRQLGYAVPERYLRPWLAKSVPDFWRRWNTYVGQWMLRYVFWPFCFRAGRRLGRRARTRVDLVTATGLLVTFGAVGLLHDAMMYGIAFVLQARMLEVFLLNGVLVVFSAWLGRAWRRTPEPMRFDAAFSGASRLCLWFLIVGCFTHFWD